MKHITEQEQWQASVETLCQRDRADRERLRQRYERAWQLARQAAEVLRRDFGVTRVVVFGSLWRPSMFGERQDTLRAMSAVAYLDEQMEVNLADETICTDAGAVEQ